MNDPVDVTQVLRRLLDRALTGPDEQYDHAQQMIQRPFSSPGYHTTLTGGTVHPTREAATYPAAPTTKAA